MTSDGTLKISATLDITVDQSGTPRPFSSAMLQTWNKTCFRGGIMEVSLKLPGSSNPNPNPNLNLNPNPNPNANPNPNPKPNPNPNPNPNPDPDLNLNPNPNPNPDPNPNQATHAAAATDADHCDRARRGLDAGEAGLTAV